MQLREHQQQLDADVMGAWGAGARFVLAVLPTGGGKTFIFSHRIKQTNAMTCAIAHRKELVSQISLSLATMGVRHNIIAPTSVIKLITSFHVAKFGRSYYDKYAMASVAGVDTLVSRQKELKSWAEKIRMWVIDECFPAGTLVDGKPIETLKVGDIVTAFDETTGAYRKQRVTRLFKNPAPPVLVKITTANGRNVTTTVGHPFWTRRGWVEALDLTEDDEVLTLEGWSSVTMKLQMNQDIDEVYNIEVEGNHTYVANGITVHNCHHVLRDNKWGIGARMFPNAIGLGVTATPMRADGMGLGAHADGVFETMVEGPSMRELINRGYLCDYRIIAPPSDMVMSPEDVSKTTGDYKPLALRKASRNSHIVGDIVDHYQRYAPGKQGITFVTDVEIAGVVAQQYTQGGVRAEAVSAQTPEAIRNEIIERFRRGELKQLVNVDLFGEGFDTPACEVVSMARPTESFGLFAQQFGRGLRTSEGKEYALILDHVKNVERHGLPDAPRTWTLDRRDKKSRSKREDDVMPVTTCDKCFQAYEAVHPQCPYCGHKPVPAARSRPEHVDGDLVEYTPEMLAKMRGEAVDVSPDAFVPVPQTATPVVVASIRKHYRAKQEAQVALRDAISWWRGLRVQRGETESQSYRRFFHTFGVDVLGAQALGTKEAEELTQRIWSKMR